MRQRRGGREKERVGDINSIRLERQNLCELLRTEYRPRRGHIPCRPYTMKPLLPVENDHLNVWEHCLQH
jgi:hypothetical protein